MATELNILLLKMDSPKMKNSREFLRFRNSLATTAKQRYQQSPHRALTAESRE